MTRSIEGPFVDDHLAKGRKHERLRRSQGDKDLVPSLDHHS